MDRFVLFLNGQAVGSFKSECAARSRFLDVCANVNYECDCVVLVDLELDGNTIAEF